MTHWEIDVDSIGIGTVKLNGKYIEEDIRSIDIHMGAGEVSKVIVTYVHNKGTVKVEEKST